MGLFWTRAWRRGHGSHVAGTASETGQGGLAHSLIGLQLCLLLSGPPIYHTMSTSNILANIDHNTTLCLACSSSLPPLRPTPAAGVFKTPCCRRPICPSCLLSNPRLARYDPCLACLGGVGVVGARMKGNSNVDGAVRDADMFVLGDDEDDDRESGPPSYSEALPLEVSEAPPAPLKYYINRRDTLQGIALRFGIPVS